MADTHRGSRRLAPGDNRLGVYLRVDSLRKIDSQHPIAVCEKEFQSGRVFVECIGQIAHLIMALANHRVIADRIDPGTGRGRADVHDAVASGFAKRLSCRAEIAIAERPKASPVAVVWGGPRGNLLGRDHRWKQSNYPDDYGPNNRLTTARRAGLVHSDRSWARGGQPRFCRTTRCRRRPAPAAERTARLHHTEPARPLPKRGLASMLYAASLTTSHPTSHFDE